MPRVSRRSSSWSSRPCSSWSSFSDCTSGVPSRTGGRRRKCGDGDIGDVRPDDGEFPGTLDRSGYELEFDETFTEPGLDPGRWVAHYLPHWTTPERSAARYELEPGVLRLRIDADQPAWRSEDGELRVSNIQTGTFAGPLGSPIGQHRHRPDLAVRTPRPRAACTRPPSGWPKPSSGQAPTPPACWLSGWLASRSSPPPRPVRFASQNSSATPSRPTVACSHRGQGAQ